MQLPGVLQAIMFRADALSTAKRRPAGRGYSLSERLTLLILMDGVLVFLAVWGATVVAPSLYSENLAEIQTEDSWGWFPLLLFGGWWLAAGLYDLYDVVTLQNRRLTAIRVILTSLTAALVGFLAMLFFAVALGLEILLCFLGIAIPLLILWRLIYIAVSTLPLFSHRTLIVGRGERAQRAAKLVKQHAFLNCKVMGYVNDTADASETILNGLPVWNEPSELAKWVRQTHVHEIVIATEGNLDRQLFLSLIECQANGTQIIWLPDLYERFSLNLPVDHIDSQWLLHAVQFGPDILQRTAKRVLDLVTVIFILPIMLILFPLIAALIKLDSPGPVFYRQVRCGRGNQPFMIYKFRTMSEDAERDGKARWATRNDPRITRVGRLLRKTRLDELPQLLNILQGEMSIVGPRPERPEFVEELKQAIPFYHTRLLVKPGLTGWAQVRYDYTSSIEDTITKLHYDLYYIHHWSLWLDIFIMFKTISVVLKLKGT